MRLRWQQRDDVVARHVAGAAQFIDAGRANHGAGNDGVINLRNRQQFERGARAAARRTRRARTHSRQTLDGQGMCGHSWLPPALTTTRTVSSPGVALTSTAPVAAAT